MAEKDEHLKKAADNEKFLKYIEKSDIDFPDWYVTCLYYIAIHYLEAYLAIHNIHPTKNSERTPKVDQFFNKKTWFKYRLLKDVSEQSRYDITPVNITRIKNEIKPALDIIINNSLEKINSYK